MQNNQEFKLILLEDLGMMYPNESSKQKRRYGLCKCHCGKEFRVQMGDFKNGKRKSCGCLNQRRKFSNKEESTKHHKKLYSIKHKEEIARKQKEYYLKNKQRLKEKQKIYYENNKEESVKRMKEYNKTEKGKMIKRNIEHKRRTATKKGDVTTEQYINMINTSTNCYWCNCKLNKSNISIDHYIPISKGGLHTLSNLVATCLHCNKTKHGKDPLRFANEIGRLF